MSLLYLKLQWLPITLGHNIQAPNQSVLPGPCNQALPSPSSHNAVANPVLASGIFHLLDFFMSLCSSLLLILQASQSSPLPREAFTGLPIQPPTPCT